MGALPCPGRVNEHRDRRMDLMHAGEMSGINAERRGDAPTIFLDRFWIVIRSRARVQARMDAA